MRAVKTAVCVSTARVATGNDRLGGRLKGLKGCCAAWCSKRRPSLRAHALRRAVRLVFRCAVSMVTQGETQFLVRQQQGLMLILLVEKLPF